MSGTYQLPCTCGESIEIRATQAGELLKCAVCGTQVTVPTMREVRQLEPVTVANRPLGKTKPWTITQGIAFSTGLAIALIGLATLAWFGRFHHIAKSHIQKPDFEKAIFQLDWETIDLLESWKLWTTEFREKELGYRRTPIYIMYRNMAARLTKYMLFGGGLAISGALIAASSFLFGGKPSD